jgi:hypothetical protein
MKAASRAYVEAPRGFDVEPYLIKSNREISHYTVIFVVDNKWVSSGTFVNACGYDGILTAQHVAKPVLESSEIGLCIAEFEHRVELKADNCEHVIIGANNLENEFGPDLSFIIIRDPKLLATLKSLKSFYHLDNKDLSYFESPLEKMAWSVAGSPDEGKMLVGQTPAGGPIMRLQNFVGLARFLSRSKTNEFDFLKLEMPCTDGNYPANYQGMSGGGIWLVPFSIEGNDESSIRYEAPVLGGVSFFQSEPKGTVRVITGHGHESIYHNLRKALFEKK